VGVLLAPTIEETACDTKFIGEGDGIARVGDHALDGLALESIGETPV